MQIGDTARYSAIQQIANLRYGFAQVRKIEKEDEEDSLPKKSAVAVSYWNMKYIALALMLCGPVLARGDLSYDFRASEAYRQLAPADRQRLEQVRRDQVLLWGALDMYADEYDGQAPETLDALVPRYLAELPKDPFATTQTAAENDAPGYAKSKDGWGYRYKRGAPGNRAWVLSSVGLPDFPYLAEHGNVGLYICKGLWISGRNPVTGHTFKDPKGK